MRSKRGNHSLSFFVAVRFSLGYASEPFGVQTPGHRVSNLYKRGNYCYEQSPGERACMFF